MRFSKLLNFSANYKIGPDQGGEGPPHTWNFGEHGRLGATPEGGTKASGWELEGGRITTSEQLKGQGAPLPCIGDALQAGDTWQTDTGS